MDHTEVCFWVIAVDNFSSNKFLRFVMDVDFFVLIY